MEQVRERDDDIVDPLDWNVMLRLPRSSRRGIERKARQTRTPVAVLLRSWVLERAATEGATTSRAGAACSEERAP